MRVFTTPKNFKKGKLIANQYRWIDMLMLIGGITLSVACILIYFAIFEGRSWVILLCFLVPGTIGFVLTLPLGIYHNVMEYLKMINQNRNTHGEYIWEGIYRYDSFKEKENV